MGDLLTASFCARDAVELARALLGKRLVRGAVTLAITETEAYRLCDSASHARFGATARNAPMWGPPGRAYVFLCYGIHRMLNVVADAEGVGAAVLIRACAPVAGAELVWRRRGGKRGPSSLAGPGKVGQALEISVSDSDHPLCAPGGIELRDGPQPAAIAVGPRVGIDYAAPADRDAPWRFAVAESPWVSHRARLQTP